MSWRLPTRTSVFKARPNLVDTRRRAGDEIVLKTGDAQIIMKKNGAITIQGKAITIKGSGNVVVKGQKILQN